MQRYTVRESTRSIAYDTSFRNRNNTPLSVCYKIRYFTFISRNEPFSDLGISVGGIMFGIDGLFMMNSVQASVKINPFPDPRL